MANHTLSTWTHPTTGETRIYVNGLERGVKAFFVKHGELDAAMLTVTGAANRNQKIRIEEKCEELAQKVAEGQMIGSWSKMLAAAK